MKSLKAFAIGTAGTAVFTGIMTVYFWVMYWVATHVWAFLQDMAR